MGSKQNNQIKIVAMIIVAVLIGTYFAPQIGTFIDGVLGGSTFVPDTGGDDFAPHKFIVYKRGTTTELADAEIFAWYDWDGNGAVKLGEYPDGEIESLSSATTTGLVSTAISYPVGEDVLYQVHLATYEVETFTRSLSSIPNAHDGTALSVPNVYITLTDTGATRISMNGELLVTSSTDYNYTLSGASAECDVVHTATSTDAGINEQAFTHWGTGKSYGGTFLGLTMLTADFTDLCPEGFDGAFSDGTNYYVWYFVDGYFNDAGFTGDERYSMTFMSDIVDAGDFAIIGLYNGVETDDLEIGNWNTVLGTSETDIDVVA